jgi:phage terminase Nu1 subunit (DNA packaging protein)
VSVSKAKSKSTGQVLKGWAKIAEFLGQTVSVAQRWQKAGMPVTRERRSVYASPEELTAWVGTERGKKEPIHIAGEGEDLLGDLRQGLSYVRQRRKNRKL